MRRIHARKREEIIQLRMKGMSIPEISSQTGAAKTTVQRYVQKIVVPVQYAARLRERQGGARERAVALRMNCETEASSLLGELSKRDTFFLLLGLYWGEGTKRDFSIINSDPHLLQAFIVCLKDLGIDLDRISLSLRIHDDLDSSLAISFWSQTLGIARSRIGKIEIIKGKKKGKLPYGMCRVRVRSGIKERLLLQAAISLIGKESAGRVLSA